jgi:hypothetical protein
MDSWEQSFSIMLASLPAQFYALLSVNNPVVVTSGHEMEENEMIM